MMSATNVGPCAQKISSVVQRTRRSSPTTAIGSTRHVCPVKGCHSEMYNAATLKIHQRAFHPEPATTANETSHTDLMNVDLKCPVDGCLETFEKPHQVSRHKWQHIPELLRPRCTGLRQGVPCDFVYAGRADNMRSHWNTFHSDQGEYVAPTVEPFGKLLALTQQCGFNVIHPLSPASITGPSSPFPPVMQSWPMQTAALSFADISMPRTYEAGGQCGQNNGFQPIGSNPDFFGMVGHYNQYEGADFANSYATYGDQGVSEIPNNYYIDPRLLTRP